MKYTTTLNTPIGKITLTEENNQITNLQINQQPKATTTTTKETPTKLLKEATTQLNEYFSGTRKIFNLPLNPKGTPFMQNVWKELLKIPYGEVATYKQIATKIQNPKASRAVGMANHKNPIPILIPCHRVIGSNKKLVGYALGLDTKEYLLNLEKDNLNKKTTN